MVFELPVPNAHESGSLIECIGNRRSIREYTGAAISILNFSRLLWSAQGVTGPDRKRATPSAGGLYPLRLHILVRRISELEPGIYAYQGDSHSLRLLSGQVPEAEVKATGIGDQPWLSDAAIIIGVAAKLGNAIEHFASQSPQGERGARYVYMESGALAQNLHLHATDLGLGGVLIAGFDDSQAKEVLKLPPDTEPTALFCVGQRRSI